MFQLRTKLASVGKAAHDFFIEIARSSRLIQETLYWIFLAPIAGKKGARREIFFTQLVFMGNDSFLINALVTAAVGAVLALQAAYQLQQFGAVLYTAGLVNVSISRELGPVMTAIVVAGRVGASVTAELGTMKVQEEVDALVTMGIPSIPYLVVPRIMAMLVMVPCLTILGDVIGMAGGFAVGTLGLGIGPGLYLQQGFDTLIPKDILTGILKSFFFAFLIGVNATYQGLSVKGGAEGVGRATTQSVVISIIAIILCDCLATALFYYVFP